MKICKIDGCDNKSKILGMCSMHSSRFYRHGDANYESHRRKNGMGCKRKDGYLTVEEEGRAMLVHRQIAEKILGRSLPSHVVVHHIDGNRSNNAPNNLVICQNAEYHSLLHIRQRAFNATGDVSKRKCTFCKTYDSADNLKKGTSSYHHNTCKVQYNKERELYVRI